MSLNKLRELTKKLVSLDLDEGIRIEHSDRRQKLFINRNACGDYVVQSVNKDHDQDNEVNNIRYFSSDSDVVVFVKSKFSKNFSIYLY
jgi:hypothetical protein